MAEMVGWVGEDEGHWLSSQSPGWLQKLQPGLIARKGQESLGGWDDPQGCSGLTSGKVPPIYFLIGCVISVDLWQWPRPSVRATLGPGIRASKPISPSSCQLRSEGYGCIPSDPQGRAGSKMAADLPSTWDSCSCSWLHILLSLSPSDKEPV